MYSSILKTSVTLLMLPSFSCECVFVAWTCAKVFPIAADESSHVRVFLNKDSIRLAKDIASGQQSPHFAVEQLLQVRSNFDSLHTFALSRATRSFNADMMNRLPATIFTLISFVDNDRLVTGSHRVSKLFHDIAFEVSEKGSRVLLNKSEVTSIRRCLNDEDTAAGYFYCVLKIFVGDVDPIPIIGSSDLSKQQAMLGQAYKRIDRCHLLHQHSREGYSSERIPKELRFSQTRTGHPAK